MSNRVKKPIRRAPFKVVQPLKQFGSLWVERIECLNSETHQTQQYDFVYMEHIRTDRVHELRLAWIRLAGGIDLPQNTTGE